MHALQIVELQKVPSVQHLKIKHHIESPKIQVGSEFCHHLDVSGAPTTESAP